MGLYMWTRVLLPVLSSKSSNNPQSRDLILQLVERLDTIEINAYVFCSVSSALCSLLVCD